MYRLLSFLLLAPVSLGCGEESVNIDAVTNHACIHAEYGPFEMVVGGSGKQMPDISAAHTAFVIEIREGQSQVSYHAREEAAYVFYTNKPGTWTISDGVSEIPPFTEQDPGDLCQYFIQARGFDLNADTTYIIDLKGVEEAVTMIAESVDG